MNKNIRIVGISIGLSIFITLFLWALINLTIFAVFRGSIDLNKIGTALTVNIQLNGVLFGFVATTFACLFKRLTSLPHLRMSLAYSCCAFFSFWFAILFSFIFLLDYGADPALTTLPISFTITGIIFAITFLVNITSRVFEQQQSASQ